MISRSRINEIEILTIESKDLICAIAPALGGKIIRLYNKPLDTEFLWTAKQLTLQQHEPGADYDTNFFGGIDELLPNDVPETIDGISCPDHGELWTTALQHKIVDDTISVYGHLKKFGLYYSKTVQADAKKPILHLDYTIRNETDLERHFLWKLHAALRIRPGDRLVTSARHAQVAHPDYSRFNETAPFAWPMLEGIDAAIVPPPDGTTDFFFLYDTPQGQMQLTSNDGKQVFRYDYDREVFPYQWYFVSYGGFFDHYTAVLEPCTTMPMSVNEAAAKNQCAVLQPGEALKTSVRIYAGLNNF